MAVSERLCDVARPDLGRLFTLSSGTVTAEIIEYGARLRSCLVPDAEGHLVDVVPGFDGPADYIARGGSMGAICGRYGNRIAYGRIAIDGQSYQLSVNAPPHCLHGGFDHFGRHFWQGEALPDRNAVRLVHVSPDGDESWPGTLRCEVIYALAGNRLSIDMQATTDKATYVNLIFHGYWNLAGHDSGTIHDHLLQIAATHYTPKNEINVPSGEIAPVAGTAADFRDLHPLGRHLSELPGHGYDHNFCLDHPAGRPDMTLVDPASGRTLAITTNQPGVQVFTANNWASIRGKGGATYGAHAGVALETQAWPNTPNIPAFAPRPLRPGDVYRHTLSVEFGALPRYTRRGTSAA